MSNIVKFAPRSREVVSDNQLLEDFILAVINEDEAETDRLYQAGFEWLSKGCGNTPSTAAVIMDAALDYAANIGYVTQHIAGDDEDFAIRVLVAFATDENPEYPYYVTFCTWLGTEAETHLMNIGYSINVLVGENISNPAPIYTDGFTAGSLDLVGYSASITPELAERLLGITEEFECLPSAYNEDFPPNHSVGTRIFQDAIELVEEVEYLTMLPAVGLIKREVYSLRFPSEYFNARYVAPRAEEEPTENE